MNDIVRPIAHNLGFDTHGQLWASWDENGSTYSTIVGDLRKATCSICGKGWELNGQAFRDTHQERVTETPVHKQCWIGYISLTEAALFQRGLLTARGKAPIAFQWEKILSEYGADLKTPWYLVHFAGFIPKLKIGPRRRVYSISAFDLREEQAAEFGKLTQESKSTREIGRSEVMIHAWDEQEMTEYLRHFFTVLQMDQPLVGGDGGHVIELKSTKMLK